MTEEPTATEWKAILASITKHGYCDWCGRPFLHAQLTPLDCVCDCHGINWLTMLEQRAKEAALIAGYGSNAI